MDNKHEEIMRAIGRLEGKVDGINQRLDVVNGRLDKHSDKINKLEDFNISLSAKTGIIAGICGLIVSIISAVIIKRL